MLGLLIIYNMALVSTSHLYLEILQSAFFNIIVIITLSFSSLDSGSSSIESLLELYSSIR
jgi:hypothetical protein